MEEDAGETVAGPQIKPAFSLCKTPENFEGAALSDDSVLMLTDSNEIELWTFGGDSTTKSFNLQPSACCSLSTGCWVIGFESGYMTEFERDLALVRSYRVPGATKAHNGSVTKVMEIGGDGDTGNYIMSFGSDNVVRFWGKGGDLRHEFAPKFKLTQLCCSSHLAFLVDDHKSVYVIDLLSFSEKRFPVVAAVKSIATIAFGGAALAVLEDHSVALMSRTEVVEAFRFKENDFMASVLPLTVEEDTGLSTYACVDTLGRLTLRALDNITLDLGMQGKIIASSPCFLLVEKAGKLSIYSRDDLVVLALDSIPETCSASQNVKKCLQNM